MKNAIEDLEYTIENNKEGKGCKWEWKGTQGRKLKVKYMESNIQLKASGKKYFSFL